MSAIIPIRAPQGECYICRDDLSPLLAVTHEGQGLNHPPVHAKCLTLWAQNQPNGVFCPLCKTSLDLSALFSWQERIHNRIRPLLSELRRLSLVSLDLALLGGIAGSLGWICKKALTRAGLSEAMASLIFRIIITRLPFLPLRQKITLGASVWTLAMLAYRMIKTLS